MKKFVTAAIICAAFSSEANAVDDKTRDAIQALKFTKASAYAKAIDQYCFADHPFATQPLADAAAQEAEFRQEMNGNEQATDIIADADRSAAEHLKVDQSACAPAATFVDGVAATIEDSKQHMAAIKQTFADANAAEQKAAQAEKRSATCHDLQSSADAAGLEDLVSKRMALLDCADVLGVDNIAKVDTRIEKLRADQEATDDAKQKQAADAKATAAAADAKRTAEVAANMAKPAIKPAVKPAAEMTFVGRWDQIDGNCRGRLWDFNTRTYDGTPIRNVERNGNSYRVELSDGYAFELRDVTKKNLTWYSLESGDSFRLKRCR
ncbi:hypothetical protein [Phyllobacterium chamaecytisi]|uniref:hypothetical protein n=1 Tax=Phyllobacterium chamaecytisi TaxID=2876082 RepID=UPI001CCB5583|nr:hypothetical protein [Phyllobacterium sp. KW56]MBZ9602030.1 hypothetical protein [Phyllobacterium sp. KW56]